MFLRTWATQLWQQLSSDHPSSRAKIMGMKIKVHLYCIIKTRGYLVKAFITLMLLLFLCFFPFSS